MSVVTCPKCRTAVEVNAEHLGAEVQCGHCDGVFTAVVGKSGRRDWGDDEGDRYDDGGERPRRRSRRVSQEEEFDRYPVETLADARELARPPGMALMIVNAVSLLLLIIGIGFLVVILAAAPGGLAGPPPAAMWLMVGFYSVYGSIAVAKMIVGFIGGRALMGLRSYRWSMAGAIACIIPLDGCMSLIYIPFGIWALVVLQKPELKWAMKHNAPERSSS